MQQSWHDFPMGPNLRNYLNIDPTQYRGDQSGQASPEKVAAFSDDLVQKFAECPAKDHEELYELGEELILMQLGMPALVWFDHAIDLNWQGNFRGHLNYGSAAMLAGDFSLAAEHLRKCQAMEPEELAPYINLCQVLFQQTKDEECLEWCLAALKVDANATPIWDMIGAIHREADEGTAAQKVQQLAETHNSWAGVSLACQINAPDDTLLRAQTLAKMYHAGTEDEAFLIEYTAVLGAAQQYERIPQIVWSAQQKFKKDISWQLLAHAGQAHLALEQGQQAKAFFEQTLRHESLPVAAKQHLELLLKEC